jgi:glycosyltransferase involved in cell wall biosynthesis
MRGGQLSCILSDARWTGAHGIGRFAREVLRRLPEHHRLERGPKPLSLADPLWLLCQVCCRRPAVYFSPGFNPPPACPIPFVFTIHDLIQIRLADVATPAKRLYYEWIVKPACRRAFRVLTVSEYSRSDILKWSGIPEERVVNVGNGVEKPFEPDGPRYEPGFPYILYVGNFRPHKNLDRLFEAFRRVRCPGLRMLLAGAPSGALGAQDRIHVIPGLSDDALARVYRGASLLVLPSLMEGFGLPALEAMACGAPVVVSRRTALPEVVGDAGVYVDPFDITDIQRALECVLGDAGRRATMRALGIQRARLFSWDSVAARVQTVLEAAAH